MRNRSRLSKKIERQTKTSFFFTVIGIILILFLLFQYGIPLLANMSSFIAGPDTSSDTASQNSEFINPPALNMLPDATKESTITISGTSQKDDTINLYINNSIVDKIKSKSDGSYEFKNVALSEGENIIKTKAISKSKKESEFSPEMRVIYKNKPPKLTINSPSDSQSFSKEENFVEVTGKIESGVKVTVNGFWAIVKDDGSFSYKLPLQSGENIIKIVATDEAGNKTEAEKKVTYSP